MENTDENINDKLREVLGKMPDKLKIFDGTIDIGLQLEYFEFSSGLKKKNTLSGDEIIALSPELYSKDAGVDRKKEILVLLSSVDRPEAYRIIEKFVDAGDLELKNWAILAFQESVMLLEASLLEETRVFLSSGLGGRDGKLRYQLVIAVKEGYEMSDYREKIIINEFETELKAKKSILEKIEFTGKYSIIEALVPFDVNLRELFRRAIRECNRYGNFIDTDFVVTNIKRLEIDEIEKIFTGRNNQEKQ